MPDTRSSFTGRLLEALSLARSLEGQDPPNPITLAALLHSIQDLIAELQVSDISYSSNATLE